MHLYLFWFSEKYFINFIDAFFEATSGLTTTGATIISKIDNLPHDLLYYRQQLQLLGGMGIVVLAVAVFPMLGIGGLQLFRAEMSSMVHDKKLAPRVAHTAKILWFLYLGFNLLCIIVFKILGMSWFDAVCYGYSTASTGGFAPHDASIAYYPYDRIYIASVIFMLLGSLSFSLHYAVIKGKNIFLYFFDPECRFYLSLVIISIIFFTIILSINNVHGGLRENFMASLYQIVSLITTSGFVSENYTKWPNVLPYLLFYLAILGGCSGSTSGGIKAARILLFFKQARREIRRLIHPHGEFLISYGDKNLPTDVIYSIWSFLAIYLASFLVLFLGALALNLDFNTAFAGVASTLGNIGASLGQVFDNFSGMNQYCKLLFIVAMFLGRLEIFTFLVLFSTYFWRK